MHDAAGRCVQIAENGSTPSYSGNAIKNFIWCGSERCEQRDNGNAVVSQYSGFGQRNSSTNYYYAFDHLGSVREVTGFGQRNSSTNYYYAFDHLGSVREVTNDGGTVQGAFGFDPYGNMTVLSGSFKPDFGFTGIYQHSRTNLALTWFRQYNPALGKWLSRDPLGENAGLSLYTYTENNPISFVDPLGLDPNTYSRTLGGKEGVFKSPAAPYDAYRNNPTGYYLIGNKNTDKRYVGSTREQGFERMGQSMDAKSTEKIPNGLGPREDQYGLYKSCPNSDPRVQETKLVKKLGGPSGRAGTPLNPKLPLNKDWPLQQKRWSSFPGLKGIMSFPGPVTTDWMQYYSENGFFPNEAKYHGEI